MSNMFDHYPQSENYVPNNRHRKIKKFELSIMTGESATHSFEIPFDVNELCKDVEVIYKLGLKILFKKEFEYNELNITSPDDEHGYSIITCALSPFETMQFSDTLLDANVQLRFVMKEDVENNYKEDDIVFSEIYPIVVKDSLQDNEKHKHKYVGFGWTED